MTGKAETDRQTDRGVEKGPGGLERARQQTDKQTDRPDDKKTHVNKSSTNIIRKSKMLHV